MTPRPIAAALLACTLWSVPSMLSANAETDAATALMQLVVSSRPSVGSTKFKLERQGSTETVEFGGVTGSVAVTYRLSWISGVVGVTHPVEAKVLDGQGRTIGSGTGASPLTLRATVSPSSGRTRLVMKNTSGLPALSLSVDMSGAIPR